MKTIKDVFNRYRQKLKPVYDINEIESITTLVINEVCKLNKGNIKAFPEQEIDDGPLHRLDQILDELTTGRPLQYVLGKTDFYGLSFFVDPSVLIPRPETEELVDWVIKYSNVKAGNNRMLDIGTGSGCIAISVKKNRPDLQVFAMDVSAMALKTAALNATANNVDIQFIEADILNPTSIYPKSMGDNEPPAIPYSIIVSNPPYVTPDDRKAMHRNVTDFEPHLALFVPEDDPLLFYRAIADFALLNLIAGGLLFLEINESLGEKTVKLLIDKGFTNIELKKDLSGRDRMIRADR